VSTFRTHTARLAALVASAALLAGCSSDDNGQDVDGGTTSTQATSLSMSQVEAEFMKYRPQAKNVSCTEREDSSIECRATLDGREVSFYGTPYGETIGFTASNGAG
jgi:outer membrane murein-binding lipoprotein Lpp